MKCWGVGGGGSWGRKWQLEEVLKCGGYEQRAVWGRVGADLGSVVKKLLEAVA